MVDKHRHTDTGKQTHSLRMTDTKKDSHIQIYSGRQKPTSRHIHRLPVKDRPRNRQTDTENDRDTNI